MRKREETTGLFINVKIVFYTPQIVLTYQNLNNISPPWAGGKKTLRACSYRSFKGQNKLYNRLKKKKDKISKCENYNHKIKISVHIYYKYMYTYSIHTYLCIHTLKIYLLPQEVD